MEVRSVEVENMPTTAEITFDSDIAGLEIKLFMWNSKDDLAPLAPGYKAEIGKLD